MLRRFPTCSVYRQSQSSSVRFTVQRSGRVCNKKVSYVRYEIIQWSVFMAYLLWWIRTPNPTVPLQYAEVFILHGVRFRFQS